MSNRKMGDILPVANAPEDCMDQLPASYISNAARADYAYATWFVELPADVKVGELFRPNFWAHHTKLLQKHHLVRVRSENGSFDFMLSVMEVRQGGIRMDVWPRIPAQSDVETTSTVAPVEKSGKLCPRIEYQKATKWRVIGHDNNEHSAGYGTKEAAATALMKYMADLGFTPETVNEHFHNLGLASLMDDKAA